MIRATRTLADAIADARKADARVIEAQGGQAAARQSELENEFRRIVSRDIRDMLRNAGWKSSQGRPAPRIRFDRGSGFKMEISHLHATATCGECWVVMVRMDDAGWIHRECKSPLLTHHLLVLAGKVEDALRRQHEVVGFANNGGGDGG